MRKKLFILTIILISCSILFAEWVDIPDNNGKELFTNSSINRFENNITFSLNGYKKTEISKNGQKYYKISYKDEGEFLEVGKPSLPKFTRIIAIPEHGEVTYSVNAITQEVISNIKIFPKQPLKSENQPISGEFILDDTFYQGSEIFPKQNIEIGTPAIMRDLRVVQITINPFQYDPATRELEIVKNVDINIKIEGNEGKNIKTSDRKLSRVFEPLYRSTILNYEDFVSREEYQDPSYLFIFPNDNTIEDNLESITEWKHQKGFVVHTASTQQTGSSVNEIKNYIQDAYDNWQNPPEFICIVGDAEGSFSIPTVDLGYNGYGDHGYVRLEGNDILADAFIGRLSFDSYTEFQTIIAKLLNYEKEPHLTNTDWYNETVLVGDPSHSGTSTIDTNQHIKEIMTLAEPDMNFTEAYSGAYSSIMTNSLNNGVSYFNYRGWLGMSGFDVNNILSLNNGFMLPFTVILTCGTGSFNSSYSEAESEVFLRAGAPGAPKGAIASIGTATTSTHTCFNNSVSSGIFYGIFVDGISHAGGALNSGKLNLYLNYPQPATSGYVENFSYWNSLMGDPGMDLWTRVPQELIVNYETQVATGTNYLDINVEDSSGDAVKDAWITALMGEDDIFVSGYTDDNGFLHLPINAQIEGSAHLTVTKQNYIPHLGNFTVGDAQQFVNIFDTVIDDDNIGTSSGNNDGVINPGEEIELQVMLKNFGVQTADNVVATITSPHEFVTISDDTEDYGNIVAGNAIFSADDFDFNIDSDVVDGTQIELNITIEDDLGNQWTDVMFFTVSGAFLYVNDYTIQDPNGIIEPGETAEMFVNLENLGSVSANNVNGTLFSNDSRIVIEDDIGVFGNVSAGGFATNSSNTFEITTNTQIIPGSQFSLELNLYNSDGYNDTITFPLYVGEISLTDPLGPDTYGYYIYDDGDTDYYNAPVYNWIEINNIGTDLNLNDNGNTGDIADINLPITFRFYGEEYNSLTVCSNGWVAPGHTDDTSFMNWIMPGPQGPSPMIAPFWDDLMTGDVYHYYDSGSHSVIIEWDGMQNEYNNAQETFQLILYDANYYPTSTGDSEMKIQYKEINNVDQGSYPSQHGQFATVGIEDHSATRGLEYTFNDSYPLPAKELENEMALLITGPPIPLIEPFLTLGGVSIFDDNGNGQADYGENIDLEVNLNNLGENAATGVIATISTNDDYVTINQGVSNYSNILGGNSGVNLTDFNIDVAEDCPDGHIAGFDITIVSNEDSWDLNFTIELNAPEISLNSVLVDDGDNNILDPGETADILCSFANDGGASVYNSIIEISTQDQYLTLNSTSSNLGDISSGSISTAVFNVTVDSAAPTGHGSVVDWLFSGDLSYEVSDLFVLNISQIPVMVTTDFSGGTFPPDGWDVTSTSGQINWDQSSSNDAGGTPPEAKFSWSPSTTAVQRLMTDPINTLGSGTLELEFRHMINDYSGSGYTLRVETTSDGINWNTVVEYPAADLPATLENVTIDTEDVGSETFQLSFTFDGDSYDINYWYLDDVIIEGGNPQGIGYIEGNVVLSGGTGNLEDVVVSSGNHQTHPDANGDYLLPTIPGTYDVIASLAGYETVTETNVQVLVNQTTTLDFELTYLQSPENLTSTISANDVTLQWDIPIARTLQISHEEINTGRKKVENSEKIEIIEKNNRSRSLSGFKVYRNDDEIAQINDPGLLTYDDTGLNGGNYSYYITALYDDSYESDPSNIEQVNIVLYPPTDLIATTQGMDIYIEWEAPTSNRNITGYKVYRGEEFIEEVLETNYLDENITSGSYTYFVTAIYGEYESEPSVEYTIEHTNSGNEIIPKVTKLHGNYPNPFNPSSAGRSPSTTINFELAESSKTNLSIYNIKGQKVKTMVDEYLNAAKYSYVWDGKDDQNVAVTSGVYFYKFKANEHVELKKMLLLK